MDKTLKFTVAQLNPVVGDVSGNLKLVEDALAKAREDGSDIVVFSELFLLSYPPEDLVRKPGFWTLAKCHSVTCKSSVRTIRLFSSVPRTCGNRVYNGVFRYGTVVSRSVSINTNCNYGVFDVARFVEGRADDLS